MMNLRIPRIVSKALMPFILLFGLYVQFHGDYGPGGGFQAGVIFASAFVLHALVFGSESTRKVLPMAVLLRLMALGVLIYLGTGVATMVLGGAFLDYGMLAGDPENGQHYGIMLVELGVGVTVASTVVAIFLGMLDRGVRQ